MEFEFKGLDRIQLWHPHTDWPSPITPFLPKMTHAQPTHQRIFAQNRPSTWIMQSHTSHTRTQVPVSFPFLAPALKSTIDTWRTTVQYSARQSTSRFLKLPYKLECEADTGNSCTGSSGGNVRGHQNVMVTWTPQFSSNLPTISCRVDARWVNPSFNTSDSLVL